MKTKFLTTNIDVASVAAFVITLWGFMSLRQMDTPQGTPKLKRQRWRKIGITVALIVFISGGLLIGANAIKNNTENPPPCTQRTKPECIKDMPEPICPPQQQRVPCPLDTAR